MGTISCVLSLWFAAASAGGRTVGPMRQSLPINCGGAARGKGGLFAKSGCAKIIDLACANESKIPQRDTLSGRG